LGGGPTVPHMAALCGWADACAAERRRLEKKGGRLTCACGRWAALLLRPLDAVRDRNPRRVGYIPREAEWNIVLDQSDAFSQLSRECVHTRPPLQLFIIIVHSDEEVANRDTKVWHGATEKGP
jgi:hypothetical protein